MANFSHYFYSLAMGFFRGCVTCCSTLFIWPHGSWLCVVWALQCFMPSFCRWRHPAPFSFPRLHQRWDIKQCILRCSGPFGFIIKLWGSCRLCQLLAKSKETEARVGKPHWPQNPEGMAGITPLASIRSQLPQHSLVVFFFCFFFLQVSPVCDYSDTKRGPWWNKKRIIY